MTGSNSSVSEEGDSHFEVCAKCKVSGLRELLESVGGNSDEMADSGSYRWTDFSRPFGPGWSVVCGITHNDYQNVVIALKLPILEAPASWGTVQIKLHIRTLGGTFIRFAQSRGDFPPGPGKPLTIITRVPREVLWDNNPTVRKDNAVLIVLQASSSADTFTAPITRALTVHQFFTQFISGAEIHDVKFLFYNHIRTQSGAITTRDTECLSLFANRQLLVARSSYFRSLLDDHNTFSESSDLSLDGMSTLPPFAHYEYESDSDIGDAYEEIEVQEAEEDSHSCRQSQIDTIMDDAREHPPEESWSRIAAEAEITAVISPTEGFEAHETERDTREHMDRYKRLGKEICIPDFAHATWEAMLLFLATNYITFAPLRARNEREAFVARYKERYPSVPVPSSPKSIYRLADKLGLDLLKK